MSKLDTIAQGSPNSTGEVTLSFDYVPQGSTYTGTVSIPGAPLAAVFQAYISGQPFGNTWTGPSTAGPFQVSSRDQLVIKGTNCLVATTMVAYWNCDVVPEGTAAPVIPAPNPLTPSISTSVLLYENQLVASGGSLVDATVFPKLAPVYHTLVICGSTPGAPSGGTGKASIYVTITNIAGPSTFHFAVPYNTITDGVWSVCLPIPAFISGQDNTQLSIANETVTGMTVNSVWVDQLPFQFAAGATIVNT